MLSAGVVIIILLLERGRPQSSVVDDDPELVEHIMWPGVVVVLLITINRGRPVMAGIKRQTVELNTRERRKRSSVSADRQSARIRRIRFSSVCQKS